MPATISMSLILTRQMKGPTTTAGRRIRMRSRNALTTASLWRLKRRHVWRQGE